MNICAVLISPAEISRGAKAGAGAITQSRSGLAGSAFAAWQRAAWCWVRGEQPQPPLPEPLMLICAMGREILTAGWCSLA